jgi:hypothetical protein
VQKVFTGRKAWKVWDNFGRGVYATMRRIIFEVGLQRRPDVAISKIIMPLVDHSSWMKIVLFHASRSLPRTSGDVSVRCQSRFQWEHIRKKQLLPLVDSGTTMQPLVVSTSPSFGVPPPSASAENAHKHGKDGPHWIAGLIFSYWIESFSTARNPVWHIFRGFKLK